MKLWRNTTKRLAKKRMRHYWKKIKFGSTLKPGDLISTCRGYNERLVEVIPCWTRYGLSKGTVVFDFDIVTESGTSCSLIHCCTVPTETREEIIKFWSWYNTPEGKQRMAEMGPTGCGGYGPIEAGLEKGDEVFDADGQPLYEYCSSWEKKARFPERWAEEQSRTR